MLSFGNRGVCSSHPLFLLLVVDAVHRIILKLEDMISIELVDINKQIKYN